MTKWSKVLFVNFVIIYCNLFPEFQMNILPFYNCNFFPIFNGKFLNRTRVVSSIYTKLTSCYLQLPMLRADMKAMLIFLSDSQQPEPEHIS